MVNITKEKLEIDNELKKKIEFICSFCNTTPTIINGNIRKVNKTNLNYIEPYRIIIKGITFLAFNYSKTIYVGSLANSLEIKDLESFMFLGVNMRGRSCINPLFVVIYTTIQKRGVLDDYKITNDEMEFT